MNEEKAVLEFFSQPENLHLALSVGSRIEEICEQMNSRFWRDLKQRVDALPGDMQTETIEDHNAEEILLGLRCKPDQPCCLSPILEQQHIGGKWRIFQGLAWQGAPALPSPPAVSKLKHELESAGCRSNEHFLAWKWTDLYPRRSDFLLEYAQQPGKLLLKAESALFMGDHLELINNANAALAEKD